MGQDLGGNQDGGKALFRLDPGVGGHASNGCGDHVLGWGGDGDAVDGTLAIEYDTLLRRQPGEVQVMYAHKTALLGAGEGDFDGPVATAGLPY